MNAAAAGELERGTDVGSRRLTIYYIAALSTVALLAVVGQWLVQSQLAVQLNDSKVVNLAGRQRMLSQRLCKCAALSATDLVPEKRATQLTELRELLPTWKRTQQALQFGDAELGLPANESRAAAAVFARIEPTFAAMLTAAERLVAQQAGAPNSAAAGAAGHGDLAALLEQEAEYLRGMDEIVSRYEVESHERVARLLRLERILLSLTLVVLLIEGVFVFRPAARRIAASIAALRRAGEQLRAAKETAESADRIKTRFLANMSHELRTPLHAVLGAAELLRTSNPNIARADYLDVVDDSGRMLLCLLNDVLDLSKIEADKIDLHPTPLVLGEFVRRTISMFHVQAQEKRLELRETIDADVPVVVAADAVRLRQVLANLLHNGIKFTDQGSVALHIAKGDGSAGTVRFEVVDTGAGIAAEDQARIFESFTQLEGPRSAEQGGAGLGLAISARLVALMGGKLEVRSEEGKGSAFSFSIPCATTPHGARAVAPDRGGAAAKAAKPRKILAAEDSPVGRRILEEFLRSGGHTAVCVADGAAAIAAFEQEEFELVLLDVRMPTIDGPTAARAIRAFQRIRRGRGIPIVALTADPLPQVNDPAQRVEFDDYVTKPFTFEVLQRAIERAADGGETRIGAAPGAEEVPPPTTGGASEQTSPSERRAAVLTRLQGRVGLLNELVELFAQEAPLLFTEMEQAAAVGDIAAWHTAAHRLRGQLEMFEVVQAASLARRLELACAAGDREQANVEFDLLADLWPTACREVAALASVAATPNYA